MGGDSGIGRASLLTPRVTIDKHVDFDGILHALESVATLEKYLAAEFSQKIAKEAKLEIFRAKQLSAFSNDSKPDCQKESVYRKKYRVGLLGLI